MLFCVKRCAHSPSVYYVDVDRRYTICVPIVNMVNKCLLFSPHQAQMNEHAFSVFKFDQVLDYFHQNFWRWYVQI